MSIVISQRKTGTKTREHFYSILCMLFNSLTSSRGTRASSSESSILRFFFLGFSFFHSDRPIQYQETHSTLNEKKEGEGWGWPKKQTAVIKHRIVFFKVSFPYKDRLRTRAQLSRVVYKAGCWDCQDFFTGKTKRSGLQDRKTEHFKAITSSNHQLLKTMWGQLVIT